MAISMVEHNIMHIITASVAAVLFVISLVTYIRNKKTKFLFICGAFLVFSIKETILAYNMINYGTDPMLFLTHVFNLVILILFALGILR